MAAENDWTENRYEVAKECRYLVQAPAVATGKSVLVVALHGYGQNPEDMLRLTRMVVGKDNWIVSLAGPNVHFLDPNPATSAIGYNWGARNHWTEAVRLHHAMLNTVLARLHGEFGVGPGRTLLLGYSQPVGLNYRFVGTYPGAVGGVVGICGGVPKGWEDAEAFQTVHAPILHIARDEDEFFPAAVTDGFKQRLEAHATNVTFHRMEGPHRFPSKAGAVILPWMEKVFA